MLQSEFETHTDIFPDVLLYDAAEHEYMTGDWDSKAGFCHDFKFDVDGLAQKCQRIANERWAKVNEEACRLRSEITPLADQCEKLRAENNRLEDENENLRNEIASLSDRVDELMDEVGEPPEQGVPKRIMMLATMMQALIAAAMDDNKADTILHQVWAYQYLLDELHEELKDK